MILCENLVKRYKDITVLQEVSVAFEANRIHGLIGRNGSGKSVLLKCICGLISPTSGRVSVNGKPVRKDGRYPVNLGAIIESPGFLPYYSGYGNLKKLASIRGRATPQHIRQAMAQVGLDPDNRKWVSKYSSGMKQRLGIAQAIMENPDMLVLDEPMNGLDNAGVKDMRQLFKDLRGQGKTILLASHNPRDIEELCDTVSEMDGGVFTAQSGFAPDP